jgi:hypothetical protein
MIVSLAQGREGLGNELLLHRAQITKSDSSPLGGGPGRGILRHYTSNLIPCASGSASE